LLLLSVEPQLPEFQISRRKRRVDDLVLLPIDGRFRVVAFSVRKLLQDLAGVGREKDIEARVDGPDIALAAIRARRTSGSALVSRRVDDVFVVLG